MLRFLRVRKLVVEVFLIGRTGLIQLFMVQII
nr:MAG TPA: CRAL/TRIO, N-terminal domain [Crassvirales sp.]